METQRVTAFLRGWPGEDEFVGSFDDCEMPGSRDADTRAALADAQLHMRQEVGR